MKLILISDPSSVHTRNWIDGLEANGVDIDVIFIRNWILREGHLLDGIEEKTTLIDVPSFSGLVANSIRSLSLKGMMKDFRYGTRMHQTIRLAGQRIREIAEERETDIIHAHGLASSILLAYSSGVRPYSASAWGSDIYVMPDRYPYLKPLMARAISDAALIHVESEISANRVKLLSSSGYSKMFVSTWGVDTEKYTPDETASRVLPSIPKRYILSFRSLEPLYRVDTIIKAFAIVAKDIANVMLVIGGDGTTRHDLEKLARSLDIEDRVFFTGFVDADDKRVIFSNALLYVQCPESDGVSLAMMEAMSSGLPLVSTNVGETSVLVKSGENGTLIDIHDPQKIASAMLQILTDDALRIEMGKRSRQLAIENHDRSKFFRLFVKAIQREIKH